MELRFFYTVVSRPLLFQAISSVLPNVFLFSKTSSYKLHSKMAHLITGNKFDPNKDIPDLSGKVPETP